MKRLINYTYNIDWEFIPGFKYFLHENNLVKYDAYLNMEYKAKHASKIVNNDKNSRRAIIYSDGIENPACLTSIQFLIVGKTLHVICNFRSQHEELGRPNDTKMINFIVTKFKENLNIPIKDIIIVCHIGDYHLY